MHCTLQTRYKLHNTTAHNTCLPIMIPLIFYIYVSQSQRCAMHLGGILLDSVMGLDDVVRVTMGPYWDCQAKKPTPGGWWWWSIWESEFSDGFGRSEGPESMCCDSAKVRSLQTFPVRQLIQTILYTIFERHVQYFIVKWLSTIINQMH